MAWYSGVSGGCCARPPRLLGSNEPEPIRSHWPFQSGYLASSQARAEDIAASSATAVAAMAVRSMVSRGNVMARSERGSLRPDIGVADDLGPDFHLGPDLPGHFVGRVRERLEAERRQLLLQVRHRNALDDL